MNDHPRISAIIISYNQEDVIARTLDSLLSQESLYEICVSDDCSKDRTWPILQEYSSRYPGVFKLHRNEPNLGIFANEEKTWKMPSGDLVYRIAGDDVCPEGYFKAVADFICANGLDWKNDCFAVVGKTRTVYPDGQYKEYSNKLLDKKLSPLKLKLRDLLEDRSACFSRVLLDRYIPVSQGRSYKVEAAQDFQLELFCPKFYRIPVLGSIYYAEIGVSAHLDKEEKLQRIAVYDYLGEFLNRQGILLDSRDSKYLSFRTEYLRFGAGGSILSLLKAVCLFFLAFDPKLGFGGLELSRIKIALKRKMSKK